MENLIKYFGTLYEKASLNITLVTLDRNSEKVNQSFLVLQKGPLVSSLATTHNIEQPQHFTHSIRKQIENNYLAFGSSK